MEGQSQGRTTPDSGAQRRLFLVVSRKARAAQRLPLARDEDHRARRVMHDFSAYRPRHQPGEAAARTDDNHVGVMRGLGERTPRLADRPAYRHRAGPVIAERADGPGYRLLGGAHDLLRVGPGPGGR